MEVLDVLRILRCRWLPGLATAVIVAALFALFPTTMMPLPPSEAVTEVTLRLELHGTDAATVARHKSDLERNATTESTLIEARNLANVTPAYMKTGAKLTWRGPTTFDITFTGPERGATLNLARHYTHLVSELDATTIPGSTVTASSTRDVVANQRVLPAEQRLGRKALSVPLGIVAGVVCGLIVAFVVNALDRRIRGVQDLPTRGLTDDQILGCRDAVGLATAIRAHTGGPVSLRFLDNASPAPLDGPGSPIAAVADALRDANITLCDDSPVVIVMSMGALKADVANAVADTPGLVGVGLLR